MVTGRSTKFAVHLKWLRERQGLSLRALAERVGVSKVTIWKWEKGENVPRARLFPSLAQALNVPPKVLHSALNYGLPDIDSVPGPLEISASESPDVHPAGYSLKAEDLAEVILRAKLMISEASGAGPDCITISIEY